MFRVLVHQDFDWMNSGVPAARSNSGGSGGGSASALIRIDNRGNKFLTYEKKLVNFFTPPSAMLPPHLRPLADKEVGLGQSFVHNFISYSLSRIYDIHDVCRRCMPTVYTYMVIAIVNAHTAWASNVPARRRTTGHLRRSAGQDHRSALPEQSERDKALAVKRQRTLGQCAALRIYQSVCKSSEGVRQQQFRLPARG